ncbi:hypothetical protein [Calidifontibacillus oryziterrae]|uniref:hypothetical protein n=1 Tax=Calidifontibacillus oryziterrae TaxID=1191699 RepID=UPI0003823005|nr:hypothetical protein [Calidifontibacillus oryziterrae]
MDLQIEYRVMIYLEWFKLLLILAIVLYLFATFQFYRFWKGFKNLNIGDTLSIELRDELRKKIKAAIIFVVIGGILNLIGTIIRPF